MYTLDRHLAEALQASFHKYCLCNGVQWHDCIIGRSAFYLCRSASGKSSERNRNRIAAAFRRYDLVMSTQIILKVLRAQTGSSGPEPTNFH